jgi:hypothetical protein
MNYCFVIVLEYVKLCWNKNCCKINRKIVSQAQEVLRLGQHLLNCVAKC